MDINYCNFGDVCEFLPLKELGNEQFVMPILIMCGNYFWTR